MNVMVELYGRAGWQAGELGVRRCVFSEKGGCSDGIFGVLLFEGFFSVGFVLCVLRKVKYFTRLGI